MIQYGDNKTYYNIPQIDLLMDKSIFSIRKDKVLNYSELNQIKCHTYNHIIYKKKTKKKKQKISLKNPLLI